MGRFAIGAPEPEAAHGAHRHRDRPRRRDDQRHVRPDRLDRPGVRQDLHGHPQGLERGHHGKSAFDLSEGSGVTEPTFDETLLPGEVRELPGVAEAEGSVDSDATQLIGDDGKAVVFGGAPNLGFSIANGDSRVQSAHARSRAPGRGRTRSSSTRRRRRRRTSRSGRRSASRPRARSASCGSRGSCSSARASRSAARRSPASTSRPRSACSRRSGARRDRRRREAGRDRRGARRADRGDPAARTPR